MIDTGANVSLVDVVELNKICEKYQVFIYYYVSVSYTHLDVYKRQDIFWVLLGFHI